MFKTNHRTLLRFATLLAFVALGVFSTDARAEQEGDKGTLTGTITEKGEGWLRVKPAEGESQRFMARWIGGMPADGGGLEESMVRKIREVPVGAQVKIGWVYEERKRVVDLAVLKQPEKQVEEREEKREKEPKREAEKDKRE